MAGLFDSLSSAARSLDAQRYGLDMSGRLSDSLRSADDDIRGAVDQTNALAAQIARLNVAISGANGADVETLKDQQGELVKKLTGIADVNVMTNDDGSMDVAIGSG